MATRRTCGMRSLLRLPEILVVLALVSPAALAAEAEPVEDLAGGQKEAVVTAEPVLDDSTAAPEGDATGKGKRQALYSGPFSSLLSQAYQYQPPAQASGGSAATLVSSGSQKAAAYQPLAGLGLPLGYGSASAALSPSLLRSAYPGLLGAGSSPLSNYSSASSPLGALLSAAASPAAQFSAPHNFTLPVAANLLAQGSSYVPARGFYASPSATNLPQNFTFGQPAASTLFAQNSAAYPSFYPAPSGFRQHYNAGLFGAASTPAAFAGSVVAQGAVAPGTAGSPFTFFSYPVSGRAGQQAVATVGVSNHLLAPHRPLSLAEAKQRFPQYFSGVEEPYARFQQQLQQLQQPQPQQQQLQQPFRQPQQQQQPPLQPTQHSRPAEPPKPAQVTEFPEEQRGSGYARPPPSPTHATSVSSDDDDDSGSYEERPAYKSSTYHSGAGVDHHKIRAEQESEDEEGSERHPNSYQRVTFHNKPYHEEEESGKSSYPGYYPKAAYYRNHHMGSGEEEDSRRPQESTSGDDDDDDEDHRPAYSSNYQSGKSRTPPSRYHPEDEADDLEGVGPRLPVKSAFSYSYSRPYYSRPKASPGSEGGPDAEETEEESASSDTYNSLRFPSAELDSHFNRAAAATLGSSPGGPRPAAQTLHTYRFKLPDYATETYSPVTGRPSRTKSGHQRRPYQEHAEEDEEARDEDSEGRYSSPVLRVHKATWSYSRSQTSTR